MGRIGGIQRFSINDGPGIRSTVFFKGCPLRCQWCHNPELMSFNQNLMFTDNRCIGCGTCLSACPFGALAVKDSGLAIDRELCRVCLKCTEVCPAHALHGVSDEMTVEQIMETVIRDKTYYQESGGGVTLSGGEVLSQGDFALKVALACRAEGISVALDTSGYGDHDSFIKLAQASDVILFDVKAGTEDRHLELTGVSLELIRKNLDYCSQSPEIRDKVILRFPLIAGVNDTDEDMAGTCSYLAGKGFTTANLLPYHDLGLAKCRHLGIDGARFAPPSDERLREIGEMLAVVGIKATRSKGEAL